MEVTPKDMMGFGAYLVENEHQVVEDTLTNDMFEAMKSTNQPVIDIDQEASQ